MATVNSIPEHRQSPSAMRGVMVYCQQQQKVHDPVSGRDLVSGIHCGGATAYDEFMLTKQVYGKTGGVLFYQFTQSFDSRSTISSADAHALALKFAERAWPGHEVLVCTHCDTDNPHSHFVVNSVSWQDGWILTFFPCGSAVGQSRFRRSESTALSPKIADAPTCFDADSLRFVLPFSGKRNAPKSYKKALISKKSRLFCINRLKLLLLNDCRLLQRAKE